VRRRRADFAEHAAPPPGEAERGQLLRAFASDAIRGGLERHFGVRLAFQNCHRVAAFRTETVGGDAYRLFVSPLAQIRTSRRSCATADPTTPPILDYARDLPDVARQRIQDRRRGGTSSRSRLCARDPCHIDGRRS
jgi:hypothetical protein